MQKRQTRQKSLVSNCFISDDCYTADDIMSQTALPKATVYRVLKTMVDDHALHTFTCQGKTVYSNTTQNHCTFTCCHCGTTKHIKPTLKMDIQDKIHTVSMDITGTCVNCQTKSK